MSLRAFARRSILLLSLAPLAFGVPASAVTITPEQAGVANFGQINESYFRGAQPNRDGFRRLGTLGIKTVIDLQEQAQPGEPEWVQEAGMKYFNIPLSGSRPANQEQTARFLELVSDSKNWPVYVHCAAGRHRTGEMTGIYRIAHDGWTADRAYQEMQKYGYYSFPNHGSLKRYVYSYFDDYKSKNPAGPDGKVAAAGVVPSPVPSAGQP
ncbi:MAG TPA: tyrosine-protein phosphatase [Candidatus Eisenbacteria bacterium]|jgi:protein tyrosine/serine phosphatase|nr:tyrosine-protein phosphatase [Candidatus Eisenbacteria bacterium]